MMCLTDGAARNGHKRFPKCFRLLKTAEFDRVFREGRRRTTRRAVLLVADNGLGHPRMGIIAGRKLGKASVRNRIKRLFREAFRLNREALPPGQDIVVIPKKGAGPWSLELAADALLGGCLGAGQNRQEDGPRRAEKERT